jgi:hypothetical protein
MRAVILSLAVLVALGGLAVPAPVRAAPAVPHEFAVGTPTIMPVRQRCGQGMKRQNAWQDKQGAWHGKCVPKRSKPPAQTQS